MILQICKSEGRRRKCQGKLKVNKFFYKHSQSKLKIKSGRCNLQVKNDTKASTPKGKAEMLNKFLVVSSLMKSWQICSSLKPVQILT